MRIIGDVHGRTGEYLSVLSKPSIQLGDLSFNYDFLKDVDPNQHKFIFGNHDRHPDCLNVPHCLGKYGTTNFCGRDIFFLSGAWSIDYKFRKNGISWWPEEELSIRELEEALDLYKSVKPNLVLSHSPPEMLYSFCDHRIAKYFRVTESECKSRTAFYLQEMFNYHAPKKWFFGHLHLDIDVDINDCHFVGVNQGTYCDYED